MHHLDVAPEQSFSSFVIGHLQTRRDNPSALVHFRLRLQNGGTLAAVDAAVLSLALLTAAALRSWLFGDAYLPMWLWGILPLWGVGAWRAGLLPSWGLGAVESFRRVVLLTTGVYAAMVIALFMVQEAQQTSRFLLLIAYAISLMGLPLARMLAKTFLVHHHEWGQPTAIYGAGHAGREVIRLLDAERGLGYNPVCLFDDNPDTWNTRVDNIPVVGSTDLATPRAPVAILAMPELSRQEQLALLEGPLAHYHNVIIMPDLVGAPSLWVQPRDLGGVLGLEIRSNLTSPFARFQKRAAEMIAVGLSAPFWLPVCGLLTALIWLEDRASPFFLQRRIGRDGTPFDTYKFRTMVPNAEAVLKQRMEEDPVLRAEWETHFKLKNDPRITRVGRLLRKTSLDELPQLFNVLKGDMSLVGPRPLPAYHQDELPRQVRDLRERVLPGLTGLWQVSGRSDIGNEGMEQLDPYYVRNWSLWLDAVVLVRTIKTVALGSGAY